MTKKCSGCGVVLQTKDKEKEGYIDDINKTLCLRCFKIKNYGEYSSVSLDNKDYINIINNIPKDALVVYLTSLLNINLDYIKEFAGLQYIILTMPQECLQKYSLN